MVLLRTVYSQAQGCVCTALQLVGDVEQPWLMSTYDVFNKTGSTQHITTPPEEDRATAIGDMHKNFGEDQTCSSSSWTDKLTDTETDTIITILFRFTIGGGVVKPDQVDTIRYAILTCARKPT